MQYDVFTLHNRTASLSPRVTHIEYNMCWISEEVINRPSCTSRLCQALFNNGRQKHFENEELQ